MREAVRYEGGRINERRWNSSKIQFVAAAKKTAQIQFHGKSIHCDSCINEYIFAAAADLYI